METVSRLLLARDWGFRAMKLSCLITAVVYSCCCIFVKVYAIKGTIPRMNLNVNYGLRVITMGKGRFISLVITNVPVGCRMLTEG